MGKTCKDKNFLEILLSLRFFVFSEYIFETKLGEKLIELVEIRDRLIQFLIFKSNDGNQFSLASGKTQC